MSEPTLTLGYVDFAKEIGLFQGWKIDDVSAPAGWALDSDRLALVDLIIQSALRTFYYDARDERGRKHKWNFFKPLEDLIIWPEATGETEGAPVYDDEAYSEVTAAAATFYPSMVGKTLSFDDSGGGDYVIASYTSSTVVTVVGDASAEGDEADFTIEADGDYRLPDNFGGIDGDVTFVGANTTAQIHIGSEQSIRARRGQGDSTGRPWLVAVMPLASTGAAGQRWVFMVWPTPDEVYTMRFRTNAHPNKISTSNPYPLGGTAHGQTILEGCLAEAERRRGDTTRIHENRYRELLVSSIAEDRTAGAPENMGYCGPGYEQIHTSRLRGVVSYEGE